MKKLIKPLLGSVLMVAVGTSHAATTSVNWDELPNFTDIEATQAVPGDYAEKVKSRFNRHFTKLGNKLPDGYTWQVKVTDIDLAGTTNHGGARGYRDYRVLDTNFKTKVAFTQQVLNNQGKVVLSSEHVLAEDNYDRFPKHHQALNREFGFEKHMINRWFYKDLLRQVRALESQSI